MPTMDREMMRAYQRRWQAVAKREAQERRQTTVAQRWLTLNALLRMAVALGVRVQEDDREDDIMRQRWNRLRGIYLSGREGKPQ